MKWGLNLLVVMFLLTSCNNGSVKENVNDIGKKFDSSAEKLYDSAKERAREIKDRVRDKFNQKDSAH